MGWRAPVLTPTPPSLSTPRPRGTPQEVQDENKPPSGAGAAAAPGPPSLPRVSFAMPPPPARPAAQQAASAQQPQAGPWGVHGGALAQLALAQGAPQTAASKAALAAELGLPVLAQEGGEAILHFSELFSVPEHQVHKWVPPGLG